MKRFLLFSLTLLSLSMTIDKNPFFSEFETPFGTPDFSKIKIEHYLPAFRAGIAEQLEEIKQITESSAEPDFENTAAALEYSGALLNTVSSVFFNLNSANTSPELQAIAKEVTPMLSKHGDDIGLNAELFSRIKTVYEKREALGLSGERLKLLEENYKSFVRRGANLNEADKVKLRKINERLSLLTLKFGENVLAETNAFEMVLEKEADLSGLPASVRTTAAETAKERGHDGKWIFTIQKPSLIPFLTYSEKRDLREKMLKAYIHQGDNDNEHDNKSTLVEIAKLRIERANLLGFKTHAHYVLDDNMAKTPEAVYELLNKLWKPALKRAKAEAAELQEMIYAEGGDFKLEAWDWWYYAEKLKKAKYEFDDELLRPYFELENVRRGAFEVATKLFGITFEERTDIPKYHEAVRTFEVKDADGSHIGIYYVDYHPRASKRGGAWMNSFRKQSGKGSKKTSPLICNVSNVSKATTDKPALLSLDEVGTIFHEFGHALHGLLSECQFESLSGTSVARDFVEMPSQVMENWATEPEVLALYAKHYQTGKQIPTELIEKMNRAQLFNQGFETVEYLAAAFLDLDWHAVTEIPDMEANELEEKSLNKIGLIPEIVVRYRSPYFRHIFSGGYSSGYYSYIWAEVLDADAFQAFKENGLFDKETAIAFRRYIFASGGTEDAMTLYKRFRGAEPKIEALLTRRGLN